VITIDAVHFADAVDAVEPIDAVDAVDVDVGVDVGVGSLRVGDDVREPIFNLISGNCWGFRAVGQAGSLKRHPR